MKAGFALQNSSNSHFSLLHFFVPFIFGSIVFLPVFQLLAKAQNTFTWNNNSFDIHETIIKPNSVIRIYVRTEFIFSRL